MNFKPKLLRRDKEGHCILIKEAIHQEEITILYTPTIGIPNFIKHTLKDLKSQTVPNMVVAGNCNTPLLPTDRSSR
jgi:hypothetical protein